MSERFAEEKVERVWHPGFVRLEGFCTDWNTRKSALSAKTADIVFEDFFKGLTALRSELLEFIDKAATMRKGGFSFCNTLTFKLMPKITSENAYRPNDALESWAANQEIRAKYEWIRSSGIFVSVESPPWSKPHLTLGNRAREILVRHGIDKMKMKVEFGPPCRI